MAKSKFLIIGISAFLLAMLGGYYFYKKMQSVPPTQVKAPRKLPSPAFHPDQVLEFEWQAGDKKYKFQRSEPAGEWSPQVDPQDIYQRLNIFTHLHQEKKNVLTIDRTRPYVNVSLKLEDGTIYAGSWQFDEFVWDTGPHRGQGAKLVAEETRLFQAGQFAFTIQKLFSWCSDRPRQITVSMGNAYKRVEQKNNRWQFLKSKEQTVPVDATFMENWLGEYCVTKSLSTADLSWLSPQPLPLFSLQYVIGNNEPVIVDTYSTDLVKVREEKMPAYYNEKFGRGLKVLWEKLQ